MDGQRQRNERSGGEVKDRKYTFEYAWRFAKICQQIIVDECAGMKCVDRDRKSRRSHKACIEMALRVKGRECHLVIFDFQLIDISSMQD